MPVIQPTLSYSDLAASGLANGTLYFSGGVIRETANGHVFAHLKDAASTNQTETKKIISKESTNIAVKNSTKMSLGSKFAIGSLIVVGVTALAYGGYKLYTYIAEKSQTNEKSGNKKNNDNNSIISYNPDLTEYFNSIQSKTLTIKEIKKVITFFDAYSNDELSIEISQEELLVLRNLIVRYTKKLLETNNIELESKPLEIEASSNSKEDILKEINKAIKIQEEVFLHVK